MHFKKQLLATAIATLATSAAWATNGYAPHGIGQKAQGMGGVGVAYSQDALAGGINPAGMVHVGNRIDLGINWFRPIRSADIVGNIFPGVDGHYDGSDKENFLIPEFGYNRMLDANSSFGVSVFGTGGMNTDYANGIPLFNSTGARTGVDLAQLFIVPTYSMKLNENHSVGIGLNLAVQAFEAQGLQNFDAPGVTSSVGNVTNNGHDFSYGAGIRLGWQGKVSDTVTLGATYQTRTYMSEFDDYAGLFAEQGDFDIPENFALGIAVQATPKLLVAADVMRINYSELNSVGNGGPMTNPTPFPLGGDNAAGFGWDDQTIYKLGIAYQYSNRLTLRAGLNHADQPIPAAETLFNILAPATVEDHLTLGATWILDNGSELTFSYMHAFENTVNGAGSIPPGFPPGMGGGNADLKMYQDAIGVAYSWKM